MPAKPLDCAASVHRCNTWLVINFSSKNMVLPLWLSSKTNHNGISSLHSLLIAMNSWFSETWRVSWINRLRKARPAIMTEHAKFKTPIKDCMSLTEHLLFCWYKVNKRFHFSILSWGNLVSLCLASIVMPTNSITWVGSTVLSDASGIPISAHMCKNNLNFSNAKDFEFSRKRTSSKIWTTSVIPNLLRAIHSIAVQIFCR